ncbi:ABC transporter permease [Phyllobacterium sophorae]|uniref:Peptide ABC transporter permease n=1 Tax=Phyllobacterium sophorae TaxID=1520277 RepID=A0A2P7B6Z1_9HYPH|nr:ABC transporter permease [Phyllobacterium sophorae]PSH62190.1 peptide ABC transporter permease [Phyllobacterium sophorae]
MAEEIPAVSAPRRAVFRDYGSSPFALRALTGPLRYCAAFAGRLASAAVVPGVVLLGLLFVVFAIGRLLPTDPVLTVIGDHAPQELYEKVRREMHLDKPIAEQFVLFGLDMARGDFGVATTTGNPVVEDIGRFLPATIELASVAITLGVGLGVPIGLLAVRFSGRWPDNLVRLVMILGNSLPIFWMGLVGLLLFYAHLGWVGGPGRLDIVYQYTVPRVTGLVLVDTAISGNPAAFGNAVSHIALPASLLGLVALSDIARTTRGFLLWQYRQDYINVARLKGLSETKVLWRHALPNAAGPLFAVIAWSYAYLLEGAVLTETVFAWPGLGLYITQSLMASDMRAVLAATLIIGTMFMVLNMVAEIAQTRVDPRTRA